jgi:hypothetical protein
LRHNGDVSRLLIHMRTAALRLFFAYACLFTAWESGGAAQEPIPIGGLQPLEPHLKKAFEEHLDQSPNVFQQIENLEYKASSKLLDNAALKPSLLSIVFANDARYQYDYTAPYTEPPATIAFISGYDNEFSYKLEKKTLFLTIGRESAPDDQTLYMKNYGLLPFLFFPEEYAPDPKHSFLLKPVHLADPLRWASFKKRLNPIGVAEILGKKAIAAEIDSGIDFYTQSESRALVYFSIPDGFYPIGWDLISKKEQIPIMEYRVEEIGKINVGEATLQYPQKATRSYYNKGGKLSRNNPSIASIAIHEIKVNQKLPEDRFTIDPASASGIYDSDAKTYLAMPK